MQQQRRSSSDDWSNKDHEKTSGEGKSGGNAGAGKSGKEGLGTEKKTDDERFGSSKPSEKHEQPKAASRVQGTLNAHRK